MEKIGIIGGSGLDDPQILKNEKEIELSTPYGQPSSSLKTGKIKKTDVVILARHGKEHTIPPTSVNNRANIYALKELGCTHILATTAVGSLKEEIKPGELVIIDQFIDFTRFRKNTFFDEFPPHDPQHTSCATPFDEELRHLLIKRCEKEKMSFHAKGTVITIEGPRFSTRAESKMFQAWGADIINMSIAPEAILAKEAEIPYAVIAMTTDYDCWKTHEEPVSWETILKIFNENAIHVTNLLQQIIPEIKC